MDDHDSGPQARTRHHHDRRASYITDAAKSLASLERRVARLDGQSSSPTAISAAKGTTAAADLDVALNKFGEVHNILEDRVHTLEMAQPSDFENRLKGIEQRLEPNDEYMSRANDALRKLQDAETRLQSNVLLKQVAAHEEILKKLLGRRSQDEPVPADVMSTDSTPADVGNVSTNDLAIALTCRLDHGDVLGNKEKRMLHAALYLSNTSENPLSSAQGQSGGSMHTPITDDSGADEDSSPIKRRRKKTITQPKKVVKSVETAAAKMPPPPLPPSSARMIDHGAGHEVNKGTHDVEMEDVRVIPPEVRRTSRAPKPTPLPANMVHWKDANKSIQNLRPSPQKPSREEEARGPARFPSLSKHGHRS